MQDLKKRKASPELAQKMLVAIDGDGLQTVLDLLNEGFDLKQSVLNQTDSYTAMHMAAMKQRKEICRALISAGADVNAKNKSEATPLFLAAFRNDVEIGEMLLAAGARLHDTNSDGDTALHWSVDRGAVEASRWLLDRGINPNHPNKEGQTPLHYAAYQPQIAAILVERGAQTSYAWPNANDKYLTPFQSAVADGALATVRYFVEECGEDVAQKTRKRKMMSTIAKENPEVKIYLLSLKTDSAIRNALPDGEPVGHEKPRKSAGMSPI